MHHWIIRLLFVYLSEPLILIIRLSQIFSPILIVFFPNFPTVMEMHMALAAPVNQEQLFIFILRLPPCVINSEIAMQLINRSIKSLTYEAEPDREREREREDDREGEWEEAALNVEKQAYLW